jgi:membrane-bound inhibitor of C-type lysozyme
MQQTNFSFLTACTLVSLVFAITACSSVKSINPFGNKGDFEQLSNRKNYVCDENNRFSVELTNQGKEAWVIYNDHQVNVAKNENGNRYTAGAITLELNGDETKLTDGDKSAFTHCKAIVKPKAE